MLRDRVALLLALTVLLVLVIFAGAAAWALDSKDLTLSAESVAFLTTSTGALIGTLGAYLGVKAANGKSAPELPPEPVAAAGERSPEPGFAEVSGPVGEAPPAG